MSDLPDFNFGPMAQWATQTHEMFKAFCEAGFSEDQAMEIILRFVDGLIDKYMPGGTT